VLRNTASVNPQAFFKILCGRESAVTLPYTSAMKNWQRNFDEAPFNENRSIIKLNTLLLFVSFQTYFVHVLFFCFFSLLGWVLLANSVLSFAHAKNSILVLPVLFLPSVLFWTSGVMKEPLLVLGLGLLLSAILNFEFRISNFIKITVGVLVILLTKFFVLACLFPALLAYVLFGKNENKVFTPLKHVLVIIFFLLVAFNFHTLVPPINLSQMLMNKQMHSVKEAAYFKAGSQIEIPRIENNAVSFFKAATVGIWNTFTQPYIGHTKNVLMLLSAFENLIVLTFLFLFIACTNWRSKKNMNLFFFLVVFSLSYFALTGMCTPVAGNLVRYKTPLLPLFMFAFILQVEPKAIAGTLNFALRNNAA
jgi:hypothetical protein